jgi:hypothetical protein
VTAPLGAGRAAAETLAKLHIETVLDLAANTTLWVAAAAGIALNGRKADGWFGSWTAFS